MSLISLGGTLVHTSRIYANCLLLLQVQYIVEPLAGFSCLAVFGFDRHSRYWRRWRMACEGTLEKDILNTTWSEDILWRGE